MWARTHRWLGAGLLAVLAAGCLDSAPGGGAAAPGGGGAQGQFGQASSAIAQCSGGTCHDGGGGPQFMGRSGQGDDYQTLTSPQFRGSVLGNFDARSARIILRPTTTEHYGRRYDNGQRQALESWLNAERAALQLGEAPEAETPTGSATGGTAGGATTGTVSVSLSIFASCMTKASAEQTNMLDWAQKNSTAGACGTCHTANSLWLPVDNNDDAMFAALQKWPAGFFGESIDPNTGVRTVQISMDKLVDMSNAPPHPRYDSGADDEHMQYLGAFYQATLARANTGECGSAAPPVPPKSADIGGCSAGGSTGVGSVLAMCGLALALALGGRRRSRSAR